MKLFPNILCRRPHALPTEATLTTSAQSLRWITLSGYHSTLFTSEAPQWAALDTNPNAQLVKANPIRRVYRVQWRNFDLYAKVYRPKGIIGRIKWHFRNPPSQSEFELLQLARQRRVPTAKPLAWTAGRVDGKPVAVLITESLGPNISLEDLLWQEPSAKPQQLSNALNAAATALARLHCAGIDHRDLHPGNILINTELSPFTAYITNLQDVHVEQRGGHASADPHRRYRPKNLAVLLAGMRSRLAADQLIAFVEAYLKAVQPQHPYINDEIQTYFNQLLPLADRQDQRVIASRDRRALRNSRYARKITLGNQWTARAFLQTRHGQADSYASQHQFTTQDWKTALANVPDLLQKGQLLKQGARNSVLKKELKLGPTTLDVVVKHARLRPGLRGLIQSLLPSRATRQWHYAHALLTRRIPTAWPLAALEHRQAGRLRQSILLCEHIPDSYNLKLMLLEGKPKLTDAQRVQIARQIGVLLAQLRLKGIRHRDCKASNIMLRHFPKQKPAYHPYLIDLDGISKRRIPLAIADHEALTRLAASSLELETLTHRDRLTVFRAYCQTLNIPINSKYYKRLRNEVSRQALRQARKTLRNETRKQLKKESLDALEFKNILIIKPSSLGDVLRCLPVLNALRRGFPQAKIAWLVRPDCAGVIKHSPALDEIILFDRKHFGKMLTRPQAARDFFQLLTQLRNRRFDLVLDLQGLFRSGFITALTGAPVRIGFAHAREFAHLAYTHKVKIPNQPEHVVKSYFRFAQMLNLPGSAQDFAIKIDPDSQKSAQTLLSQIPSFDDNTDYVVLLIGGTEAAKRWPTEKFALIADWLDHYYQLPTVLLGAGLCEAQLAEQICQKGPDSMINLVNKTAMDQLLPILKSAKLVLGNDSGPLHIAAALGMPTVGLYGPTNPDVVGPFGANVRIVQAGKQTPRTQKRYSDLEQHQMQTITIEMVTDSLKMMLDSL